MVFFEMYLGGGLAPSSQTVPSLSIPPGQRGYPGKWSEHNPKGFEKLKNLNNS
jgi:hypothetical protein